MRISDWSSDVCSSDLRIGWAFDARMAEIIRSTREPMIGQMRLTWWREALTKDPKVEGSGEPLMDALRRQVLPLSGGESLLSTIAGWEVLLQLLPLSDIQLRTEARRVGKGCVSPCRY